MVRGLCLCKWRLVSNFDKATVTGANRNLIGCRYCLPAYLDKNLSRLMRSGQLFVGQKIKVRLLQIHASYVIKKTDSMCSCQVCGASMQGCEEAMPPLDVKKLLALHQLPTSCTRTE